MNSNSARPSAVQEKSSRVSLLLVLMPLASAVICLLLVDVHLRAGLGQGQALPVCGGDGGCQVLASSPWSYVLGISLPFWGLAHAVCTAVFALHANAKPSRHVLSVLLCLFGLACLIDIALAWIMTQWLETLCWLCLANYLCHGLGFVLALVRRWSMPAEGPPLPRPLLALALALALIVMATGAGLSAVVAQKQRAWARGLIADAQLSARPLDAVHVERWQASSNSKADSNTNAGSLSVWVFHDLRCQHCRRLRRNLEGLARQRPGWLRLSFVHCPIDSHCHKLARLPTKACERARAALEARLKNKREAKRALESQLRLAEELGVAEVPTFFIAGHRFKGSPPRAVLVDLLEHYSKP